MENLSRRKRPTTAKQVANQANVSISAVSRAFTPNASISKATKKKVLSAANALGYRPNLMARSLMTRRTELIGLISNNFHNPVFIPMFDLFTRELQKRGKRPLFVNLTDTKNYNGFIDNLNQYNVDGILIASSTLPQKFIQKCFDTGIPTVHAFGKTHHGFDHNIVTADNIKGGELAAEIFIKSGYKNIGFLGGPKQSNTTQDRLKGFKDHLAKSNIKLSIEIFADNYDYISGKTKMAEIIHNNKCDAVFCGDDILAIGAIDYCKLHHIKIPDQMALIGFNNIEMSGWSVFNLTTIEQPVNNIINSSVELLFNTIENPERPSETRLFQCKSIIRNSVKSSIN